MCVCMTHGLLAMSYVCVCQEFVCVCYELSATSYLSLCMHVCEREWVDDIHILFISWLTNHKYYMCGHAPS